MQMHDRNINPMLFWLLCLLCCHCGAKAFTSPPPARVTTTRLWATVEPNPSYGLGHPMQDNDNHYYNINQEVYRKGGNARYPASPRDVHYALTENDEECDPDAMYIDFHTGDAMCWNEYVNENEAISDAATTSTTRSNYIQAPKSIDIPETMASSTTTSVDQKKQDWFAWNTNQDNNDHETTAVYRKGGNAHPAAVPPPQPRSWLEWGNGNQKNEQQPNQDDDDCEHSYIDFATGDELCWVI